MSTSAVPGRRPTNLALVLIRIVVVTFAFGVLGMALGGLLGIVAISVINLAGEHTDMSFALFFGVMPGAAIGAVFGAAMMIKSEIWAARGIASRSR